MTTRPPDEPDRRRTEGEGASVLIVDDNERNRKLATDVLRGAGIRTFEAATGAEAIALAIEHLPDVILMDLQLPDMDGTDAVRRLGEGPETSQIPVVVLSALPLDSDGEWFLAEGFAGYIEKPIEIVGFPDRVLAHRRP